MAEKRDENTAKNTLAVVCNSLTPYRVHFHRRLAHELPGLRLATLLTHHEKARDWVLPDLPELGIVDLSEGDAIGGSLRPGALLREWRRGGRTIEALKRLGAAAVVVNGYNDPGRLRVLRWCKHNRLPCWIWADSNIASEDRLSPAKRWLKRRFLNQVMPLATGFFACGSLGRAYWEHYGAKPQQVFVSPYEPDYALIENVSDAEVDAARQRYGLAAERRRLVFSGRLVPVKRVDLLIHAFAAIAAQRPEWDLVILGDGPLREALRSQTPDHLADRIKWLGFLGDQAEVSRVYRASDVLVLPSDYEPWALVVNEAVAAGMAVVASHVVAAAVELVADGANGRLFPAGDCGKLAAALLEVTDPRAIDSMRAASAGRLAAWRASSDPVEGFRAALRSAGALPDR